MRAPRPMAEQRLTKPQGFALIFEADSARQLLNSGCHLLVGSPGIDEKFDALATTWSIGVEKVLKVTLGLAAVAAGDRWPNGKDYGHHLSNMNEQLTEHLHKWATDTSATPWVWSLLDRLRDDPIWPALLKILDTYARTGRFAYLDRLVEVTNPPTEPRRLWPAVESAVVRDRPDLRQATSADSFGPRSEFDAALLALNETVCRSTIHWWFTVTRLGAFGAYGEQGRQFTPDLEPGRSFPALPSHLLE